MVAPEDLQKTSDYVIFCTMEVLCPKVYTEIIVIPHSESHILIDNSD